MRQTARWAALALVVALAARAQDGAADGGTAGGLAIEEFAPASPADAGAAPEPLLPTAPASPVESFSTPASARAPRFFGEARALLGVDTSFDSAPGDELPENVFDLRGRARLGVDAALSAQLRVLLEGRVWWRSTARRGLEHAKASFEATLGEAYVDLYSPQVDLRVGNQVLAFGANAALAPADSLNPRDLRESFVAGEPEDAKLPVFALRALGTIGKVEATAAYVPFFAPNRYSVFGQDEALVQPAVGAQVPKQLHASVEDELQGHLLETERPAAFPWLGDVGVRLRTDAGKTRVGASWVWANEKLPAATLDPELTALMGQRRQGREDAATAVSVQNRLLAGEELVRGSYPRHHVLSLEATRLVGPAQLDLDLSWSPRQTFADEDLSPVGKSAVTWVVGVSQAEDSDFTYSVTYLGLAVPEVSAGELLLLLEPPTARGAARTAWFHLLVGVASYRMLEDKLELSVRAAFEPLQRSYALAPRVAYDATDDVTLSLGAEVFQGSTYSPFGYFDRNDQVVAGISVRLP